MPESKNADTDEAKKPLRLSRPGRLELKKTVETGQVRQSFPHGRSKTVTVEVKRKRSYAPGAGGKMTAVAGGEAQAGGEASPAPRTLTESERATRVRALQGAMREEEAKRLQEAEAARHAEEESRRREEEERRRAEEEARRRSEDETRRRTEEEARRRSEEEAARHAPAAAPAAEAPAAKPTAEEEEEEARRRRPGKAEVRRPRAAPRAAEQRRRAGKLTITQALEQDDTTQERVRSLASMRRQRERERQRAAELAGPREPQKIVREVVVPESITVQDLANRMAVRGVDVVKSLMKMGVMATVNQPIDADTAEIIVNEFGHQVKRVAESDVEIGLRGAADTDEHLEPRAPVVTVMGHVDHGKTSLLDALRETDTVAREAGGITQHIGAYQVALAGGQRITFIDTPGHAAFSEMRARGANVTDIVVLVVAADDGVKEQTVEALHHAKAAGCPIIIAINKCDRPDANPDRVRQELLQHEIVVEAMGGEVLDVEVSAVAKTGLDKLEEAILLQSELLELRANPDRPAEGVIIEARLDRGRGSIATVLVQRGTLEVGEIFVAGMEWGRVRALISDRGAQVDSAGPSVPVEVLGLTGTPAAGEDFVVVPDEGRARDIAEYRQRKDREKQLTAGMRGSLEQMFDQIKAGEAQELPVVIKGDVQGSVEALVGALTNLRTEEVQVRVLHAGVGGINESDITLAAASSGLVIGFNVRANPQARAMAKRDNVDIRYYAIIYNVIDDVRAMLSGMLAPAEREVFLGNAEIREVFSITKVGKVAGCMVTDGQVRRGARVRLLRDNVVIHEGALRTLKRHKDDVREVKEGYECGMSFENYQDIQVGDVIECFEIEEVARAL